MLDWVELEEFSISLDGLNRAANAAADSAGRHSVEQQIAAEEARRAEVVERLFRRIIDQAAA